MKTAQKLNRTPPETNFRSLAGPQTSTLRRFWSWGVGVRFMNHDRHRRLGASAVSWHLRQLRV
eukprot:13778449-Heterocapsa_arctica.AAC.1